MNDRIKILIVTALLLLLMTACGSSRNHSPIRTVTYMNREYVIDNEQQTIACEGYVYHFDIVGNEITLTYPNGATYNQSRSDTFSASGWSDDYDPETYIHGDDLVDALYANAPSSGRRGNPLAGILLLAVGVWNAFFPYSAWYLSHGWRYKNAEPSDLALGMSRLGGAAAILIGILLCFV